MMLKPSIDKLLDKVPSKYSLVILQAKRAHELAAGAEPTQEFTSVKPTRVTMGGTEGRYHASGCQSPKPLSVRTGVCNPTPRSWIR